VGITALGRFAQLFDDVTRGGLIGITHPKINNIFAPGARFLLQLSNDIEDIGRESLNALKMGVHGKSAL
jgi:hypothetical protein